jgi:hypothetical protein
MSITSTIIDVKMQVQTPNTLQFANPNNNNLQANEKFKRTNDG